MDALKKAIDTATTVLKSHVKEYTRTTASGATVQVKEHDDNRNKKQWHTDASREERHGAFTKDLANLSRKTGVVVSSVGGITHADDRDEMKDTHYDNDHTSGDLTHNLHGDRTSERKVKSGDDEHKRFTEFTHGLSKLTKKHGVAVSGHYSISHPSETKKVTYDNDHTSGDLQPNG